MKIKTKFNLNNTVWYKDWYGIKNSKVKYIHITSFIEPDTKKQYLNIEYELSDGFKIEEKNCFKTRKKLIKDDR